MWIDGMLYRNNDRFYALLKRINDSAKELGILEVKLIIGSCPYFQHELDARGIDIQTIDYDSSIRLIYNDFFSIVDRSKELYPWNPTAHKFLFLTGIPSRANRIGLINKFYEAGLLSHADYSFFPPWTESDKIWCRDYLKHYTDEEYDVFLESCTRSVDDLYEHSKDYSRVSGKQIIDKDLVNTKWVQEPHYINPKVYTNTCLSILSEGAVYNPETELRFLTEKTWKVILNRHPFILADDPIRFDYLKGLGLRTFE
jgi:hypothetical protein